MPIHPRARLCLVRYPATEMGKRIRQSLRHAVESNDDPDGRPIRIRGARSDEADTLFRVQRSAALAGFAHVFDPAEHPFPDGAERAKWTGYLTAPETTVLVADDAGVPVGVAAVEGDELVRLFVIPERWGSGIGGKLHDAVVELMREQDKAECRLWVLEENDRARAFYERRGWILDGRTRVSPFPPHPPVVGYTLFST